MKQLIFNIILVLMFSVIQTNILAQGNLVKTDTMTVYGSCGQCKERIEEASYIKGVKSATWNKTTKILSIVYNSSKTNLDKIAAAIAKVGHDSNRAIAAEKDYKKLPECCAYRTGSCGHD